MNLVPVYSNTTNSGLSWPVLEGCLCPCTSIKRVCVHPLLLHPMLQTPARLKVSCGPAEVHRLYSRTQAKPAAPRIVPRASHLGRGKRVETEPENLEAACGVSDLLFGQNKCPGRSPPHRPKLFYVPWMSVGPCPRWGRGLPGCPGCILTPR